jgi:hypothetical protein
MKNQNEDSFKFLNYFYFFTDLLIQQKSIFELFPLSINK